jgi:hypothetical protein
MKNLIFFVCIGTFLIVVKMVDKWVVANSKKKIESDNNPAKWEKMPLREFDEMCNKN